MASFWVMQVMLAMRMTCKGVLQRDLQDQESQPDLDKKWVPEMGVLSTWFPFTPSTDTPR